jgi:hypothetical protein
MEMEFHLVDSKGSIPFAIRSKTKPNIDLSKFERWNPQIRKALEDEGDCWFVFITLMDLNDLMILQKKAGSITFRGNYLIEVG